MAIATSSGYIRPNTFVKDDVAKINPNINHIMITNSGMMAIVLLMHWAKKNGYTVYSEETTYLETRGLINYTNLLDLRKKDPEIPEKAAIIIDSPNVFGYSFDIKTLAEKAHKVNSILIVDCSYCSSFLDTSLSDGADFVVEALAKYTLANQYTLLGAIYNNSLSHDEWHLFEACASNIGVNINNDQVSFLRTRLQWLPSRMATITNNASEVAKILQDDWGLPATSSSRSGVIVLPYDLLNVFSKSTVFTPFATYGGDKSIYTQCVHNSHHTNLPQLPYLRLSIGIEDIDVLKQELDNLHKIYTGTNGFGDELSRLIKGEA